MKRVTFSNMIVTGICVMASVLTACRPDTACRSNMTTGLCCEFRRVWVDDTRQKQVATIWDSITVVGIGNPDTLYNNVKGKASLTLPLHGHGDSTLYALTYHEATDTICIYHTNQQEFVSIECGCAMNHTLVGLSSTSHWIDSIAFKSDKMQREGETNIELWRTRDI